MTDYGHAYTNSQELNSVSGPSMQFRSLLYTEIPNPQSIAVSPDGKTAWVMSSYKSGSDNSRTGRIYRIDLSRFWKKKAAGSKDTGAIKAGPEIVTGHGQTLAYNPKSHELWYVRETKVLNTTLVRVNPKTMEWRRKFISALAPPSFSHQPLPLIRMGIAGPIPEAPAATGCLREPFGSTRVGFRGIA